MDQYQLILQAVFEKAGIQKSLQDVQTLAKQLPIEMTTKLNSASTRNDFKQFAKEMANDLNKSMNLNLSAKDIMSAYDQMVKSAEKASTVQIKAEKTKQAEIDKTNAKIAEQAKVIREAQKVGTIKTKTDTVSDSYANFEKLGLVTDKLKTDFEQLTTAQNVLGASTTDEQLVANYTKFNTALMTVNNTLKQTKLNTASVTSALSDTARLSKASTIDTYMDNNSKAVKKYGKELSTISDRYKQLDSSMSKIESNKLESQFKKIQVAARNTGDIGATAFDKLKKAWEKFGGWTIATGALMKAVQEIKDGVRFIGELDDAMTDVAYTSNITASGLEKLGNSSINMAKELKTSATNILEAVKIYSTANSTADDILRKAQPAIMLSNASGMTGEESSKTINTAINQFEIEDTEENLLDIVDTLEYVSSQLNYDFTSAIKEINEGIEASGSVAKNAGINIQEYSTMLGVALEKTGQSGSTIGQAYKTIFSRVTKASATEGTLDEDISAAEKSLRSVGVEVRDSEDEFRDLTDIMADLGEVWGSLSSVEKSNIGFNIAGTRQLNIVNSLLGSWEDYESILTDIDDRSGMTLRNQEVYADSLKGHLGALESVGQSVWNNLLDSSELEAGIDVLTGLLTVVDKLTSSLGGLGTVGLIGGGVGIAAFIKNLD